MNVAAEERKWQSSKLREYEANKGNRRGDFMKVGHPGINHDSRKAPRVLIKTTTKSLRVSTKNHYKEPDSINQHYYQGAQLGIRELISTKP